MSIYLKNCTYIDHKTLDFIETNIKVESGVDGSIQLIKPTDDWKPEANDSVIDCAGKFVTKSFACGHIHVYSALARGMSPIKTPHNFHENLQYLWWALDQSLDTESIEASALVTAIACAKAGCTFAIDHHASPNAINGSLETIAKAFDRVGVSHLLCYEITDRYGAHKTNQALAESENYLQNRQSLVGLHASFTVEQDTLNQAVALAEKFGTGIHIHVAEDKCDQYLTVEKYKQSVVERLYNTGALNSKKTILGHCLHLSDYEREIIRKSPVWVVQNVESNLNNNVGYFDGKGLTENIMIGTDGMHADMLRSTKAAYFVGQGFDTIDFVEAYRRLRNVGMYLETNNFSGDRSNNLVILDYRPPTPFNKTNFLGHLIFGIESHHVSHVISAGKLIVENKQLLTVNENEIMQFARACAKKLWERVDKLRF